MRRHQKRKNIEVYPKRDSSVKTLNKIPDLSVPDRNAHLTIRSSSELEKLASAEIKKPKYNGEMAERERIAQEEIKRKKKRVTILFNKGGYQLPCDADDPKSFGRK